MFLTELKLLKCKYVIWLKVNISIFAKLLYVRTHVRILFSLATDYTKDFFNLKHICY